MSAARSACWLALVRAALSDIVEYTFNVTYFEVDPDHHGHTWVQGVNGVLPGPEVRVRRGDRLRLIVNNQLGVEDLSVHWHGFEMRGAQEYDGAMGVTQCGIRPGTSFTYDFVVDEHPGTYQYHEHAHLEHVAARGMFGPLIVEPEEGKQELWEYDQEATLMLMDWWRKSNHDLARSKQARISRPGTVSALGNGVGLLPFHNLLINGKGAFNVFGTRARLEDGYVTATTHVSELAHLRPAARETWRLRIINGGALFAMRFRIDGHKLRIIQTDGSDVEEEVVDVVSMSAGERFDVLVTFDQLPGSYWMRAETLEDGPGLHHGQLGVVRYEGSPEGTLPDKGFPLIHKIQDAPHLVTMNCIDQAELSATCRSITDLKRHAAMAPMAGAATDPTHDFEVSMRGFTGEASAHFTRVIDLTKHGNDIGENQHGGEFVQFHAPIVPYSHVNGTEDGHHKNTLSMRVEKDELVRVVIQLQDRAAHPWHLHGHKFAVLGVGFPNYTTQCDVLFCRSKHNSWLSRDGFPELLDPEQAPLKDTVHVPAGGWVVLQFKADNPGWWFFHCHMAVHVHDGMGLVLIEAPRDAPARLTDLNYLQDRWMPSCSRSLQKLQKEGSGLSCSCWQNPEMKLDNLPRSVYRCSQPYLCGHELILEEEAQTNFRRGRRAREDGRVWRWCMLATWVGVIIALFASKWLLRWRRGVKAQELLEIVDELRLGSGDRVSQLVSRISASPPRGSASTVSSVSSASTASSFRDSTPTSHRRSTFLSGSRSSFSTGHSSAGDAQQEELAACVNLTDLPTAGLPVEFEGTIRSGSDQLIDLGLQEIPVVAGQLPPGSVLALLGPSGDTEPWLRFFAGRRQQGKVRVSGDLRLGGDPVSKWSRQSLRQARGYISGIQPLRPTCTVAEFLELPLRLVSAPDLYTSQAERTLHMVKFVKLFKLEPHLDKCLASLDEEVLLKVLIAQETVLPRGILMVRGPLGDLRPPAAIRMVKVFRLLADRLKVTIVFSCDGCIPREAGKLVTHTMLLGQSFSPSFCTATRTPERCSQISLPLPSGMNAVEWASEIVVKGLYDAQKAAERRQSTSRRWSLQSSFTGRSSVGAQAGPSVRASLRSSKEAWPPEAATATLKSSHFRPSSLAPRVGSFDSGFNGDLLSSDSSTSPKLKKQGTALSKMMSILSNPQEQFNLRRQNRFPAQLWTLLQYQVASDIEESITIYRFMETFGIGTLAGLVWFQKGSVDTQTALGESIGLFFFSTALYTVPPVFQVLAVAPSVARRVSCEHLSGMYPIHTYVISMMISSFFTVVIWAPVWQITAYTFADLGRDPGAMLKMQLTLALNVISMRTVGYSLAMVIPSAALNVVIANVFVQMCMLTNGFYTKLPSWLQWITVVSIPRFTLRALLKIEYSWRDTFEVHPMHGLAAFGHPSSYIPAELTGTFQLMTERQMNVMESPYDSSPMVEMLVMVCVSLAFMLLFLVALVRQVWTLEERSAEGPASEDGVEPVSLDRRRATPWRPAQPSDPDAPPTLLQAAAADSAADPAPAQAFTAVVPRPTDRAHGRGLQAEQEADVAILHMEEAESG